MRPWCMNTRVSAVRRAKPISWVTSTIVMPEVARRSSTLTTSPTSSGSSADVISSNSISRGRIASARAMATRCCWPPDNWLGYACSLSSRSTSRNTSSAIFLASKSGIDPPFEPQRDQRNRPTQHEVEYGNQRIDHHRLEGDVDDELSGAGQFYEADDRRDRGALDQLHQETYGRWNRDAKGLRQNHMTQLRSGRKRNRRRRLPLLPRDGLNRAAPDLAQERGCIHRECQRDRRPRIDANAGKHRE